MAIAEVGTQKDAAKVQATMSALDNTVTLARFTTWGAVGFQVTGTWAGTLTFECSVDGATWVTLSVTPSNSATTVTTTTANGVWGYTNNFFAAVRVHWTAFTSGAPVVTIVSRPSQV